MIKLHRQDNYINERLNNVMMTMYTQIIMGFSLRTFSFLVYLQYLLITNTVSVLTLDKIQGLRNRINYPDYPGCPTACMGKWKF